MSDHPDDNSDREPLDSDERDSTVVPASADSLQANDDCDLVPSDEEGDDEEEFSLDQLSQAYARRQFRIPISPITRRWKR